MEYGKRGEKRFRLRQLKEGSRGIWHFRSRGEAWRKLRQLEKELGGENYVYREGGLSKEEILLRNRKVEHYAKEWSFPSDHLIILGEGRSLGERSFVLVRESRVVGYGYSEASEEEIYRYPERFLVRRFKDFLPVDLTTMWYLRVLKNMKRKTETWRALPNLAHNDRKHLVS